MKMISIVSEKIIIDKLLTEFHERKNDGIEYGGAYQLIALDSDETLGILSDVRNESGILYAKIPLDERFPFTPDLSIFDNVTKQLPPLDDSINEILSQYDTDLRCEEVSTSQPYFTTYEKELLDLFIKFRVLIGSGNLCYSQANLSKDDDYFVIETGKNCPYYTGTIEVKI